MTRREAVVLSPMCVCGKHLPGRVVRVPKASDWLNANDRLHRRVEAHHTKLWRSAGHAIALAEKLPPLERAHITAFLRFGDRRRRDPGNFYPTLKAVTDGLVDAGLLPDDDHRHLLGPDMRIGELLPRANGTVAGEVLLHIVDLEGG